MVHFGLYQLEDVPSNFVELQCLNINLDHYQLSYEGQIYLELDDCKENRFNNKSGDLALVQDQNGQLVKIGHLYRNYEYLKGVILIIRDEKNSVNYRLRITGRNLPEKKVRLEVTVYVNRVYLRGCRVVPLVIRDLAKIPVHLLKDEKLVCGEDLLKSGNIQPVNRGHNLKATYLRSLYKHQVDNVSWMMGLESKISRGEMTFNAYLPDKSFNLFYIKGRSHPLIYRDDGEIFTQDKSRVTFNLNLRGGILADGMGLGKSLSFLGLIRESRGHYLKIGKSLLGKKIRLSCKSDVSLIICPGRLCASWERELSLSTDLRYKIVISLRNYKQLVKEGLSSYDVVILSYQSLVNVSCLDYTPPKDRNIFLYDWKRIILDEPHEYLCTKSPNNQLLKAKINLLNGSYKWICSSMPFCAESDFWFLLGFLSDNMVKSSEFCYGHLVLPLQRLILRKSQHDQVQFRDKLIPEPRMRTVFLNPTESEKVVYRSASGNIERLVRCCNHLSNFDDFSSILGTKPVLLDELVSIMSRHWDGVIKCIDSELSKAQDNLEKTANLINSITCIEACQGLLEVEDLANSFLDSESYWRKLIINLEDKRSFYHAKYSLFGSLKKIIDQTDECPICYNRLKTNLMTVVTPCGHLFCRDCVEHLVKSCLIDDTFLSCPSCRYLFVLNEIKIVRTLEDNGNYRWGSKMAYLNNFINKTLEDMDARIILYSFKDSMINRVSCTLSQLGINHLVLGGSYYSLRHKMDQFRSSMDTRVCLVSLEKPITGFSFPEATHLVLLDTINQKDASQVLSLEEQAIRRVVCLGQKRSVSVERIVMKDTVEHEFYKKNVLEHPDIEKGLEVYTE